MHLEHTPETAAPGAASKHLGGKGRSAMVTNYPQHLTAAGSLSGGAALVARAFTWLGQRLCGIRGHDAVLHFEGKRVMMRCTSCGHDTPGWEIGERAPRRRFDGDARRHLLAAGPRLVVRKRA
jgi:hypothetical protein